MICIESTKASIDFGLDFINITFTLEDTNEDTSDYQFDLLRANDVSEVFHPVYSNISDFECNDYTVNLKNPEIKYFYKIKTTYLPTDFSFETDIFTHPTVAPDRYGVYLSTIYGMYLDIIDNKSMYLLKRKRTGRRCDCYDDVRGSRLSDKCHYCFGTGYAGGYYRPKEIKVNYINAPSKQEAIDTKGTFEETSPIQLWTQSYPLLQENDILVDGLTGIRYTVASWQSSYKSGFLLRQTVQIVKIPEASKLYKIPVWQG